MSCHNITGGSPCSVLPEDLTGTDTIRPRAVHLGLMRVHAFSSVKPWLLGPLLVK